VTSAVPGRAPLADAGDSPAAPRWKRRTVAGPPATGPAERTAMTTIRSGPTRMGPSGTGMERSAARGGQVPYMGTSYAPRRDRSTSFLGRLDARGEVPTPFPIYMFEALVITLREGVEAALVLAIALSLLRRRGLERLSGALLGG